MQLPVTNRQCRTSVDNCARWGADPIHRTFTAMSTTRTLLLCGCAALCAFQTNAQTFEWSAVAIGAYSRGFASATDALGNVYVCGNVNGETDFDPGPGVVPLGADGTNGDLFIVKYNSEGEYVWHIAVGGSSTEIPSDLCVDHNGGLLMTGYSSSYFDWDPGPEVTQLIPLGYSDGFIAKYDTAGQFHWVRQLGSSVVDEGTGVAVDASDNVYVTGFFGGTTDFDNGPGVQALTFEGGVQDSYIAKFTTDGELQWVRGLQGSGSQTAQSIACGAGDHVYVAGQFIGNSVMGAGPGGTLDATDGEGFLCKYTGTGDFVWAKTFGGPLNEKTDAVLADSSGHLYLFGRFGSTADLDPGPGTSLQTSVEADYAAFYARLDTSGNAQWVRTLEANTYEAGSGDIAYDRDGNLFLTGNFNVEVDLDPGPGTSLATPPFPNDHFLVMLDSTGAFRWARTIITGGVFDTADALCTDAEGNVFVSGEFSNSIVFDPFAPKGTIDIGLNTSGYVAKYGPDITTEVPANAPAAFGLQVFPNPAADHITVIPGSTVPADRLEVLDASGRVVLLWAGPVPLRIPVGLLAPGPYSVAVRAAGEWAVGRFVVAR